MGNEAFLRRDGYWIGEVPKDLKEKLGERRGFSTEADPRWISDVTIEKLVELKMKPTYLKKEDPRYKLVEKACRPELGTNIEQVKEQIAAALKAFKQNPEDPMFVELYRATASIRLWTNAACGEIYNNIDAEVDELADLFVACDREMIARRRTDTRENPPSANWPAY